MREPQVILVDQNDNQIGLAGKLEAHEKGLLHRAFSVFVFNHEGKMLLQKRASHKYHSPNLWTNTCCSHPYPNESVTVAAERRLIEEMGFHTTLDKSFVFEYRAEFDNGLTEHEIDHVFIGQYNGEIKINPEEVDEYKWVDLNELRYDMENNPENYTVWFKIAFKELDLKQTA
jgi:isopentenyl-diphosphate delta-isomerase